MGKRMSVEFFCDICKEVMPNARIKTTRGIPITILDSGYVLYISVKPASIQDTNTERTLRICQDCTNSAIRKAVNLPEK